MKQMCFARHSSHLCLEHKRNFSWAAFKNTRVISFNKNNARWIHKELRNGDGEQQTLVDKSNAAPWKVNYKNKAKVEIPSVSFVFLFRISCMLIALHLF